MFIKNKLFILIINNGVYFNSNIFSKKQGYYNQSIIMSLGDKKASNKSSKSVEKIIKTKADFAYLQPFNYRIIK